MVKRTNVNYRNIWKKFNNKEIPLDEDGCNYDIHHIDGDRHNNEPSNLIAVSVREHFEIHERQGDFFACLMISRRLHLPKEERQKLRDELIERNKKNVGPLNPFFGRTHTEEFRVAHSLRMSGQNHPFYGKKRPVHSSLMKSKGFGKHKTPEQIQKQKESWLKTTADNPIRAKQWIVEKDGISFTINNLKKFCRENQLVYTSFFQGYESNGFKLRK